MEQLQQLELCNFTFIPHIQKSFVFRKKDSIKSQTRSHRIDLAIETLAYICGTMKDTFILFLFVNFWF